jgi:hypothetical protein
LPLIGNVSRHGRSTTSDQLCPEAAAKKRLPALEERSPSVASRLPYERATGDGGAKGAPKEWAGRQELDMKKLIGLAVLAAVPVACGTVPTAPDMDAAVRPSSEAAFAASGRGRTIEPSCQVDPDWSAIQGVVLNVTRQSKDSVTVRAELMVVSDVGPTPCFNPVFTVKPSGRGITLASGKDPREVTLTAPGGFYLITATSQDQRAGMSGSITVDLPQRARR